MAEVTIRDVAQVVRHRRKCSTASRSTSTRASSSCSSGPSGCGKSTLLRMLAGLEHVTSGEISIGGRVVNDLPPKDRDIAMVFQNYALYPHLTVADEHGASR